MKHRAHRPRRIEERAEEKSRGRIRELEKEIERLKRHIGILQKKPHPTSDNAIRIDTEPKDKLNCCPNCGSSDYKSTVIWTPSGEFQWFICQDCKYREKKGSDAK